MESVTNMLIANKDEKYACFQRRLLPGVAPEKVIGVRTPLLRKFSKQMIKDGIWRDFLAEAPHKFFEENQLHGFIISGMKDFDECIKELEKFLPYIDNWATCDQTSPKLFKKHRQELLVYINQWLKSSHTYTIRFAIGMLMQHFLDEDFKTEYLELVAGIKSQEYYVNMEIAWYMATALAKQWDSTIPYIELNKMDIWVHNRTIQKARESYRITNEQKDYLKGFKRP